MYYKWPFWCFWQLLAVLLRLQRKCTLRFIPHGLPFADLHPPAPGTSGSMRTGLIAAAGMYPWAVIGLLLPIPAMSGSAEDGTMMGAGVTGGQLVVGQDADSVYPHSWVLIRPSKLLSPAIGRARFFYSPLSPNFRP